MRGTATIADVGARGAFWAECERVKAQVLAERYIWLASTDSQSLKLLNRRTKKFIFVSSESKLKHRP